MFYTDGKHLPGFQWKSFGDAEIQAKYNGEIKNRIPDGYGNLYYPSNRGKKLQENGMKENN